MSLSVIAREKDLVHLGCEGGIMPLPPETPSEDFEPLLGPNGFGTTVLLDLGRANYLGSTGINWLIDAHQRFRAGGGRLVLHSLSPWLREVAGIVRLPSVLHVADDEAAATALARGTCS
jgi:anti-anti-sigma factor